MSKRFLISALIAVVSIQACRTKVELVESLLPPEAKIVCSTDWSAILPDDELADLSNMPSKFTFAATRTLKASHFLGLGIYTDAIAEPDTISLEPGKYQTLLYTSEPRNAYNFSNVEEFTNNRTVSLREIKAEAISVDKDWINRKYPGFYGPLFAGGFAAVLPAAPLYATQARLDLVDGEQTLTFRPEQFAQKIRFKVHIKYGEKLEPGKVIANVTGVPFRLELLTGDVQVDTLGQTFFPMTKTGQNGVDEVTYEGVVSVLGIVPPTSEEVKTGPGMLKVCIEAGPMKRKALQIVNLKSHLEELEPMLLERTNSEGFYHRSSRMGAFIDIETVILLESSESGGENPIWDWENHDDDVTPISDGDNEEYD